MEAPESRERAFDPDWSLGFLAAVPLFAAYEWGLAAGGPAVGRNTAELLASRAFAVLGDAQAWARWACLAAAAVAAWLRVRRREVDLGAGLMRTFLEGLGAAIVLGPLLLGLIALFGLTAGALDLPAGPDVGALSLEHAARLLGAGAWEELVFRLGCYGLVYLLLRRVALFFGAPGTLAALVGDVGALLGSSLLFAALHLDAFTRSFGIGGETFSGVAFLWRTLAGLALAGLFRWRGLGVAAWAHGLFNLALTLGAGPWVFR